MPPLIGVTTYYDQASWGPWSRRASVVPGAYFELVGEAGARPVLLPHLAGDTPGSEALTQAAAQVVAPLDGLVLIGGGDLDPASYGQAPHPTAGGIDPGRDAWEQALLAAALEAWVPVLAICRGHQLLNVHLGGTLCQDLAGAEGQRHRPGPGRFGHVEVVTVPATQVAGFLGPTASVACSHHQAIETLGHALVPSAWVAQPAGSLIEAVELPDRFVVGLQWHPEETGDLRPFAALVAAASRRRPPPTRVGAPGSPG